MTKFKYNDIIYETWNLKKELKKLGITKNDVQIIPEENKQIVREENEPHTILYIFKNIYTGEEVSSIYPNLNNLVYNNNTKAGIQGFNISEWIKLQ